jgi:hypothetical protein
VSCPRTRATATITTTIRPQCCSAGQVSTRSTTPKSGSSNSHIDGKYWYRENDTHCMKKGEEYVNAWLTVVCKISSAFCLSCACHFACCFFQQFTQDPHFGNRLPPAQQQLRHQQQKHKGATPLTLDGRPLAKRPTGSPLRTRS